MVSTEPGSTAPSDGIDALTPEDWVIFEALLGAAEEGRAEDLKHLLQTARRSGSKRWMQRYSGIAYAATSSASEHDPTKTFQVLLDNGWDINTPSSWINPPSLGDRRIICDESLVRWFLDHGADPDAPAGIIDTTPLSAAVQYAPLKIVQLLFENGGRGTRGQLANYATQRQAKDSDTLPILQLLYDKGVPMDNIMFEDHPVSQGHLIGRTTPLMNACYAGDADVVQFLINRGANLRKTIWIGGDISIGTDIPIDLARQSGAEEIVKILAKAMKHNGSHL